MLLGKNGIQPGFQVVIDRLAIIQNFPVLVDLWIKGFSSIGNRSAQEKDPNRIRRLDKREVRGPTKSLGVHSHSIRVVIGIIDKGSPPVQNQLRLAAGHGNCP